MQRAQVLDKAENRPYRAEAVDWHFRGVVVAGSAPGQYTATGPGTGSIEATFLTPDGTRSIAIALAVRPRPGLARRPTPDPPSTPSPAPEPVIQAVATPEPTPEPTPIPVPAREPTPSPTPTPIPPIPAPAAVTDSARVLRAYDFAGAGRYAAALDELAAIGDPGYSAKVAALVRQWGPQAAAELADLGEAMARAGRKGDAATLAKKALKWPSSPETRRRLENLRL
jgi:hypothetical protein